MLAWMRSRLDSSKRPRSEFLNPRSRATGLQLRLNLDERSATKFLRGKQDFISGSPVSSTESCSSLEVCSGLSSLFETCTGLDKGSGTVPPLLVHWANCMVSGVGYCSHGLGISVSCKGNFWAQWSQFLQTSKKQRDWGSGTICSVEPRCDSSQESLSTDPE